MLKHRRLNSIIFCLLLVLSVGCATGQVMTTKQDATILMEQYNAQYDDVYNIMTNPASTPSQRNIALQKKEVLIKVWPMLITYSNIVNSGGTPSDQDTAAIVGMINQLTAMSTGAVH